jgi:hypothetical protein
MRRAVPFGFALVAAAACTFPSVTYAPSDAGGEGDVFADSSSGSPQDAPASNEAGPLEGSSDTSSPDTVQDVAADDNFVPPPDATSCDQDGDGYIAEGACGGNDCCDTDPSANPGQVTFFTSADHCGSFDYNCNGRIDYEYPTNLSCSGTSFNCMGGSGFTGAPACGSLAPFCTCSPSGLGCAASCGMSTQQGCR